MHCACCASGSPTITAPAAVTSIPLLLTAYTYTYEKYYGGHLSTSLSMGSPQMSRFRR
ncbi:hypothetical protein M440DRAFT_1399526 [Trichoderma longibrachiatum ATCC 18648]|uniref:Uncharacterized protein n=1 Tax=Trichoderma longibrachiatum ATCC 18648 TaxID=983965 RepID=A0A2T4C9X5_TRILO|nr:hypothetical protein M440DRAFT_1399526 [Trichoderma longibrachiatum ATCC 18648]